MNRCPKCKYEWKDEGRQKGGSRRWSKVKVKERKAAMKRVRAGRKEKS